MGHPWSKDEVKAYFQQPSHQRRLKESILSILVAHGLTMSQVARVQASTCLTDLGLEAFLAALSKASQRGRVASPAAVIYSTLTGSVKPSIVNWLSDHRQAYQASIQARAEAERALQAAVEDRGWINQLPIIQGAPVPLDKIKAFLETDIIHNTTPAVSLGEHLLQGVPVEVRNGWLALLEPVLDQQNLSSLVRPRVVMFFLAIESLVHFGALAPTTASRVSLYRRLLWPDSTGTLPEPIILAQNRS
jgi:hypothetical protein